MKKECKQCNNTFEKQASCSVNNWVFRQYCSKGCYTLSMKGKDILKGHRNNKAWNKGMKYTLGDKSASWRGGLVQIGCKKCGNNFYVRLYRKDTAMFCSRLCKTNASNQGKTAESKLIRMSKKYKDWRKKIFERDSFTCVMCNDKNAVGRGSSLEIHADHIKPFALFPELRFNVDNGRTLCVTCHKKTDTWGRGGMYRTLSAQEA